MASHLVCSIARAAFTHSPDKRPSPCLRDREREAVVCQYSLYVLYEKETHDIKNKKIKHHCAGRMSASNTGA